MAITMIAKPMSATNNTLLNRLIAASSPCWMDEAGASEGRPESGSYAPVQVHQEGDRHPRYGRYSGRPLAPHPTALCRIRRPCQGKPPLTRLIHRDLVLGNLRQMLLAGPLHPPLGPRRFLAQERGPWIFVTPRAQYRTRVHLIAACVRPSPPPTPPRGGRRCPLSRSSTRSSTSASTAAPARRSRGTATATPPNALATSCTRG